MEFGEFSDWDLETPIVQRPAGCRAPLTPFLLRLWSDWLRHSNRPPVFRVCASSCFIEGRLDQSLLQSCIEHVLRRHEALRSRLAIVDGTPVQHVNPPESYHLDSVDLTSMSTDSAELE